MKSTIAIISVVAANAMNIPSPGSTGFTQPWNGVDPAKALADTSFRNGQPIGNAYTAGGTSPPCTGLYCQDNPIGNACPCPVWKPCKHDNIPDGHCMSRVDIAGVKHPEEEIRAMGGHIEHGTWTAAIAGLVNTGKMPSMTCMCSAGSSDVYKSQEWKQVCELKNPRWCECDEQGVCTGNACVVPTPMPTPASFVPPSGGGGGGGGGPPSGPPVKCPIRVVGSAMTAIRAMKDDVKRITKSTVQTVSSFQFLAEGEVAKASVATNTKKTNCPEGQYCCPDHSYINTKAWPIKGFHHCECEWGYEKRGEECVKKANAH